MNFVLFLRIIIVKLLKKTLFAVVFSLQKTTTHSKTTHHIAFIGF